MPIICGDDTTTGRNTIDFLFAESYNKIAAPTGTAHKKIGGDLLSHAVTHAVPSAQEGLTAVFGMETGVTPPLSPPKIRRTADPSKDHAALLSIIRQTKTGQASRQRARS